MAAPETAPASPILTESFQEDPYPVIHSLRKVDPVHWVPLGLRLGEGSSFRTKEKSRPRGEPSRRAQLPGRENAPWRLVEIFRAYSNGVRLLRLEWGLTPL